MSEDDEDEDDETDIATLLDRERQRLVRLYQDPRRREALEAERLYLQDYIAALTRWQWTVSSMLFNAGLPPWWQRDIG